MNDFFDGIKPEKLEPIELEIIQPPKINKIDYYEHPAMSQSKLKDLKKSPKHFWAKHIDHDRLPQEETEAMKLGSLFHCLLLEWDHFSDRYIIAPQLDKRTKEYKAWLTNKSWELEIKDIITQQEYNAAQKMVKALQAKKIMQLMFSMQGLIEKEFYWTDKITQVPCKMKLDFFIEPCSLLPKGAIIDFKSTQDACHEAFSISVNKYGYYNQQAFYDDS